MTKLLFRLAFAATILVPATSALAADLEPPPPVEDLRPSTYDWTGPHIGGFVGVTAIEGDYVPDPLCGCGGSDAEMSGIGYHAGVLAGWDFQWDNLVFGIEGDWAWGGEVADNNDPAEMTDLSFNDIATLRLRAGWADDRTLFYLTGGAAFVNSEFGGLVGSISENQSDKKWITGWTVGGGIEHAFTDNIIARLEYLYVDLPDTEYTLINSIGEGGDVDMEFDHMHMVRAAVNYKFSW
jgi:outer membrane immunogenic protein